MRKISVIISTMAASALFAVGTLAHNANTVSNNSVTLKDTIPGAVKKPRKAEPVKPLPPQVTPNPAPAVTPMPGVTPMPNATPTPGVTPTPMPGVTPPSPGVTPTPIPNATPVTPPATPSTTPPGAKPSGTRR